MLSLAGDTKEVRDIGYLSWKDPLAALEDPSSKLFKKTVRQEEAHFDKLLEGVGVSSWKELYSTLLPAAYPLSPEYAHSRIPWVQDTVITIQKSAFSPNIAVWILYGSKIVWSHTTLTSISYSSDGMLAVIHDIGKGSEVLQVEVYELDTHRKLNKCWKRSPIGPTTAIQDNKLYYLSVDSGGLRYNCLHCTNIKTGTDIQKVYYEKDIQVQLELLQPYRQSSIFLRGYNSMKQWVGLVKTNEKEHSFLHMLERKTGTLIPITESILLENDILKIKSKEIPLPLHEFGVDGTVCMDGSLYITTISHGKTSLWKVEEDKFKRIGLKPTHPCEIDFLDGPDVHILKQCPYEPDCILRVEDLKNKLTFPTPFPLRLVKSGIRKGVPYTVVRSTSSRSLRGLLVQAYGAYGICSKRSYPVRWLPWLAAGWAIAVIAPRGGRDNGDAWWDGARGALKKHHTFEDTAVGIVSAQMCTGVKASNTILYGRSAGGWCAAMTGQDHPELIGAIYAEVPYVDILRTTTNESLPLTSMEYEEFGDPLHHPEHFKALANITPMVMVPSALDGINMPFVLARTGLYDKQVATYEVLKWAIHLRTAGWSVGVGIDTGGGHFAEIATAYIQLAEDTALLDSLVGYTPPRHRHHSTVRHPRTTSSR